MGGDTIWNSTMTIYEKYGRAVVSPEISDVTYSVVFDVDYINDNDFNYYDSRNCFCLIPTEKMDLIIPDNYNKYNRYGDSNPRFNSALITNNEISFRTITFFENGTFHDWSDVDDLLMRMSCDVAYVPEEMYDEVIENSHYNVGDFKYFGTGVKSIQKIGKSGVDLVKGDIFQVYSKGNTIYGEEIKNIYDSKGIDVTSKNGRLPAGVYVVTTANGNTKIIIE